MLMLLDWELTLGSAGVNVREENKVKCVFTILSATYLLYEWPIWDWYRKRVFIKNFQSECPFLGVI